MVDVPDENIGEEIMSDGDGSDDSGVLDFSDSSDSEGDGDSDSDDGGSQGTGYMRKRTDFTEVFTWLTVWIMIIYFVYSSEARLPAPQRMCTVPPLPHPETPPRPICA